MATTQARKDVAENVPKYLEAWRVTKKMAPVRGHFPLVVPAMMTPYDYRSVAIAIVPAAMVSTLMPVERGARAAIFITIIVPVASESETEALGARYCGRCNRDGRQRSENVGNLLHDVLLQSLLHREKTVRTSRRSWNMSMEQ